MRGVWVPLLLVAAPVAAAAEPVRYDRDIRPILAEFCWRCHGSAAIDRRGELRLDDRDGSLAPAASGEPAIVPGRPDESGLVQRVRSADPDLVMPPPESGKRLSQRQVELLSAWVAAGAAYQSHWAFEPLRRPPLPEAQASHDVDNPIDRFVGRRLEQEGLPLPAEADRSALLRRLSFTLRGQPPTVSETRAFQEDTDPAAWTAAIDGMLGSTAYGEHWARHWMDVARYADSAGYELDYLFAHSHRYRDWLIRAFRDNLPLDRFLALQLAGDELWPDDADAADAVLLLAVGPRRFEGGIQRKDAREYEWLTDVADTVGAAFLGLSVACARCHDHKYDPLSQREYFGLQAIFAEVEIEEKRIGETGGDTRPADLRIVPRKAPATVRLLHRGEVDEPGDEALATVPAAVRGPVAPSFTETGRRAALARWLTAPDHPLTARVLVNRVWQWHFGTGLVRSPNDLGVQGDFPSHPELLDWLACELVESGWDLGHLHRLILSSRTFRATAIAAPAARERDPDGRLLSHFPRRRLEAEELRDSLLAGCGRLLDKPCGPPVVPRVEPWVLAPLRNQNWVVTEDPAEWSRRTLYLVVRRSLKLPFLDAFNGPDSISSCAARDATVVPSQALVLLNDETVLDAARGAAARIAAADGGDLDAIVREAWWLVLGREPHGEEISRATAFLAARRQAWADRPPPEASPPIPAAA
ncbi:MAG: PSD1 and planctomycete cytochrome C domain-containing protein, partial [Planctomycetia bacterium]